LRQKTAKKSGTQPKSQLKNIRKKPNPKTSNAKQNQDFTGNFTFIRNKSFIAESFNIWVLKRALDYVIDY